MSLRGKASITTGSLRRSSRLLETTSHYFATHTPVKEKDNIKKRRTQRQDYNATTEHSSANVNELLQNTATSTNEQQELSVGKSKADEVVLAEVSQSKCCVAKWEPKNWKLQLCNIEEMRKNRDAPVDSMGCEALADKTGDPKVNKIVKYFCIQQYFFIWICIGKCCIIRMSYL